MTDLDWMGPEPDDREPRKCRHPRWQRSTVEGVSTCGSCGHVFDPTRQRRGLNSRNRGNSIERTVGKTLGLKRVGHFGGAADLTSEPFVVQVKSGAMFSERYWAELRKLPVNAAQTALLIVTDAPGPGHRRRAMVVLDLDSWIGLHGKLEDIP